MSENISAFYKVENPITFHEDTAELYWKFIGDRWEIDQQNVNVRLSLPSPVEQNDIQAWLHGPVNGTVAIPDAETVTFTVPRLSSGTFFEGRVLFAKEMVPVGVDGTLTRAEIIKQEEQFIQTTKVKQSAFGLVVLVLLGFSSWAFFKRWRNFQQFGRDPDLPEVNLQDVLWGLSEILDTG
jgi:hypothetical protein